MRLDIGNALICYEGEPSVELTSGNVKYLCHPNVAATILRDGYSYETTANVSTLIPPDFLLSFMDFVYHGCIEFEDPSTPARLLKVLLQTDLTEALEKICTWVQESKDCVVCLHVWAVLKPMGMDAISKVSHTVEFAVVIICINYPTIFETPALLCLSKDGLTALLSLEDLKIPSEDFIFRAVLQWVQHDETNRSQYLVELMEKAVRLPFVRPLVVGQALASNVLTLEKLTQLNTFKFTAMETRTGLLQRSQFVDAPEGLAVQGSLGDIHYSLSINVPHVLWRTEQRYCYYNGYVFAFGGRSTNGRRRSIERMDLLKKKWTAISARQARLSTKAPIETITWKEDSDTIIISYRNMYQIDTFNIPSLLR